MIDGIVSNEGKKLSRRDFLKIGKTVGEFAAVAGIPLGMGKSLLGQEGSPTSAEVGVIDTPTATYHTMYEYHNQHPNIPQELGQLSEPPDIHFCEIISGSAQDFQNAPPGELLHTEIVGQYGESFGRLTDDATLAYFAENKTSVAYEGTNLPGEYFTNFDPLAAAAELLVVGALDVGVVMNDFRKFAGHVPFNKGDLLLNLAPLLATAWALSPNKMLPNLMSLIPYDKLPPGTNTKDVKAALENVNALVSTGKPENMQIFFRDLVMARKLQTLAGYASPGEQYKKPVISFLLGKAHSGVNDLLVLGDEVTLAGFNAYSVPVLRNIVEANGGIDAFCSTLIVPVDENINRGVEAKRLALDVKLKMYLEDRFAKEKTAQN